MFTSFSVPAPTSASTIVQVAVVSAGLAAPAGNGSVADCETVQLEAKPATGTEDVHLSTLVSAHTYSRGLAAVCAAGIPAIVTHIAVFTRPSLSVSNSAHASPVFPPDSAIASQFQLTSRVAGSPAESDPKRVRSP